jgi:transcription antitermination factor NusG
LKLGTFLDYPDFQRLRKLLTMDIPPGPEESLLPWYAVCVRSKYERRVADALTSKGYQCLLPNYREKRKWSDRTKILELPLFPGYVFSRFDVEVRLPILTTPGVVAVAGIGRIPQPLDPHEIDQIRKVTAVGHPAEPWPFLKIGQRVLITAGALSGVEGLLMQRRSETRVVLCVSLLQKAISVQVDSDAIRPV